MPTISYAGALLLALVVTLVAGPGEALGDPPVNFAARLNGDYAFSQTRVCVQSTVPNVAAFGPSPGLLLLTPATTRTTIARGILSFDGKGGGSLSATDLQINHNAIVAGNQPVGRFDATCDVSYEVQHDGSVVVHLTNCSGPGVEGFGVGLNFTVSDTDLQGYVSRSNEMLLLNDTAADVETPAVVVPPLTFERICNRSLTGIRLR